jgi:hypothetical protein
LHRIVTALSAIAGHYHALHLRGITNTPPAADSSIRADFTALIEHAQAAGQVRADVPAPRGVTIVSAHLAAAARAQHRGDVHRAGTGRPPIATLLYGIAGR